LEFGTWDLELSAAADRYRRAENICYCRGGTYLSRPMPKPIARSKTRKAVATRFKITGTGEPAFRLRQSRSGGLQAAATNGAKNWAPWKAPLLEGAH
jgi:hypothetical protein